MADSSTAISLWFAVIPEEYLVRKPAQLAWLDKYRASLSADEIARAERYLFSPPRVRFILARWLLRGLLSEVADLPAAELRLCTTNNQKPYLAGYPEIHFNVSHSGRLIAIAISSRPVGVDVEQIDASRDWRLIARHQLHADERQWLEACPPLQQVAAFYDLWTGKEAYLKGLGMGLGHPLNSFALVPGTGGLPRPEVAGHPGWTVRNLRLATGYACALAASGAWHHEVREFILKCEV